MDFGIRSGLHTQLFFLLFVSSASSLFIGATFYRHHIFLKLYN